MVLSTCIQTVLFFQPCRGSINMYPNSAVFPTVHLVMAQLGWLLYQRRALKGNWLVGNLPHLLAVFRRLRTCWPCSDVCHTCWPCSDVCHTCRPCSDVRHTCRPYSDVCHTCRSCLCLKSGSLHTEKNTVQ